MSIILLFLLEDVGSFSATYYKNTELEDLITYEGTDLNSV